MASTSMRSRTCSAQGCERTSCMPEPYEPVCAKHYVQRVERAQLLAAKRFEEKLKRLRDCN